jgi:hypothetical protein
MSDGQQYGYRILLDRDASDADAVQFDAPPGTSADKLAEMLVALFDAEEAIASLVISVDGRRIGVSTRRRLDQLAMPTTRGEGDSDQGSLPGYSVNYRFIRFRCQVCGEELRRIHVDPRSSPTCLLGHGTMEPVQ